MHYQAQSLLLMRTRKPDSFLLPSRPPLCLGEHWLQYRSRPCSGPKPLPCSLSLQLPLSSILASIMLAVARVIGRIPRARGKLYKDSHVLTVTVLKDSTKCQVERSSNSPHPKHSYKGRAPVRVPRRSLNEGISPHKHW